MSFEIVDVAMGSGGSYSWAGSEAVGSAARMRWAVDPLEEDEPYDDVIVTSSRRMLRVALAAADAGWRFAKEGRQEDPAAWMLAPRTLFDGAPAIEACQELHHFERSVVLAGLGALDAEPEALDALRDDDEPWRMVSDPIEDPTDAEEDAPEEVTLSSPLLLTAWIDDRGEAVRTIGFCAMVTDRPSAFVDSVIARFGSFAASTEFSVGFDASNPLAEALVSDALALLLEEAAEDPRHPAVRSLDVSAGVALPC